MLHPKRRQRERGSVASSPARAQAPQQCAVLKVWMSSEFSNLAQKLPIQEDTHTLLDV
jgi:hypothetical protein